MNNYDKQSNNQIKNNINILFLGLGGGDLLRSFARLFYKYQLNITAVELSSEVILVANKYFYLDKISKLKHINLNFMHDNAFDIISHDSINNHDIIIVDFFTELNSTLNLLEESYIASLYKKINQNGIIAFNVLVSDHDIFNNFINIINKYFGKNIFILNSEKLYNQMIFIFKDTKYINYLAENTDNKILSKYCTNIRPSNKGFVADF